MSRKKAPHLQSQIWFRAAPALVGLTALAVGGSAAAGTTLSTATTTPVATSTVNAGASDDITVTSDGAIKPASGVAVTLDSNNAVSNAGTIYYRDVDNVTDVLLKGGVTGSFTNSGTLEADETHTDTAEGSASVISYGAAPAIVIGARGRTVTVGDVGTSGDANGLVNRGSIAGAGVYDGVSATGVHIGVAGGVVDLTGGVSNQGSIGASAYDADSVALHILAHSSAYSFVNAGSTSAVLTGDTAHSTTAVLIEAGAYVPNLINSLDHTVAAAAGVVTGTRYGDQDSWWGPEVTLGYREVGSGELGSTTAKFLSGTTSFNVLADENKGGGVVARIAVKGENAGGAFVVEGGAETRDATAIYDLRLAAHFKF